MRCAAEKVLLSPKEVQVASLLKRGLRCHEIADALEISPATVRVHLKKMYAGLNLGNAVELAMWCEGHPDALRGQWVESPPDFRPRSERVLSQSLPEPVHKAA